MFESSEDGVLSGMLVVTKPIYKILGCEENLFFLGNQKIFSQIFFTICMSSVSCVRTLLLNIAP